MEKNLNRQKQKKLKDKLKENNAITKAIAIISLILILAGLFTFIIMGLHSLNLLVIPEFLQNIFFYGRDDGEQIRADDSDFYDFLSSDRAEPGGFSVEISLETVRGIISVINIPDNLHLETAVKYYMDGGLARTAEMSLWRKDDKYKYVISSGGVSEEVYINDGTFESFENFITRSPPVRRSANANFSFENVPHISDINYYLDLLESGSIIEYRISREIERNIIEITYKIEKLDQREEIEISLESGLVLSVRSYAGGALFYESATSVIEAYFTGGEPENTALSDDIFVIG